MKTNCLKPKCEHKETNFFLIIKKYLTPKLIKESGYQKRNRGKIKALSLVLGFNLMISKNTNTYEAWAIEISKLSNQIVSRQAVEERMNEETVALTKNLLNKILVEKVKDGVKKKDILLSSKFKNIYIEDSTVLNLPEELSNEFPGNVSLGKKKSQAKVHALYNFTKNNFAFMDIHSFSENDQSLSSKSLKFLKAGDLLLRDMGFLTLCVLQALIQLGVYFITRKSASINVYDVKTEEEINLAKLLRKKRFLHMEVLVGKEKKIKMYLIAIPLPEDVAAEKRRKAKTDRDKRANHSAEYYELLGYTIYLTNIPKEMCTIKEIQLLYGLRWQIEIIFKSWKLSFSMEKLIPSKCKNPNRIYIMIYLQLLYILLFHTVWHKEVYNKFREQNIKISLLKMAKFFKEHFIELLLAYNYDFLLRLIKVKCSYDKRNDRLNTMEKYDYLIV